MLEKVYKQIDIEKISANENQPRTVFDDEKIEELAASIKENGLIQPIIVRKYNRGYQIVAGERRYRASKLAGLKTVPCVIKDIDDKQVDTLAIIENIQRENLSPIEEANAYKTLIAILKLRDTLVGPFLFLGFVLTGLLIKDSVCFTFNDFFKTSCNTVCCLSASKPIIARAWLSVICFDFKACLTSSDNFNNRNLLAIVDCFFPTLLANSV